MTRPPRGSRGFDDDIYARRSRKRKRLDRKRNRRRAAILAVTAVFGLLFVVAGAAVTGVATFGSSCDLKSLQPVEIGQNSFIYAANNSILGSIPAEKNRQPVPLSRISPWMPKATVAIEDRRFYEHGGVDVEGIARALWKNVNAGEVVEGGSTITQQLVRNLYIGRERTVERKL
jgi:membrane peptidoglycan carboxypeptidase